MYLKDVSRTVYRNLFLLVVTLLMYLALCKIWSFYSSVGED